MFLHRALLHVPQISGLVLRTLALTIRLLGLLSRPVLKPPNCVLELPFNQMTAIKLSALVLRHMSRSPMSPHRPPDQLLDLVEFQQQDPEGLADRAQLPIFLTPVAFIRLTASLATTPISLAKSQMRKSMTMYRRNLAVIYLKYLIALSLVGKPGELGATLGLTGYLALGST